jgi:peptide/nickel transport system substrate-binding protein
MILGPIGRVRALSFVVIAGLVVSACSSGTQTQAPTATSPAASGPAASAPAASAPAASAAGPQAKAGGTAYVLMTTATNNGDKFTDMDPQRIYIGEDIAFFSATIMRALTGYKYSADVKEGTSLVGDAATDTGTPSTDAKTWTFTLRDGMKWQDGSPLKCEDFKYGASRTFAIDVIVNGPTYAIQYLDIPKDKDGNSQYPGPYKATPAQQALFDKAVVCDGNKITYHLSQPIADFNYTVTLGMGAVPNPKDHPGVDTGEQYTIKPWSDGPYMIDSYTPGTGGSLNLVRNPNWDTSQDGGYRGAYPDKWVVQIGLDPQIADQRLMSPQGDDQFALGYGAVQTQNLTTVFSDAKTAAAPYAGRAFSDYDPYVGYWWININKVKNEKIRQAMAVAIDREAIRATSGGDFYGEAGDGLLKPNIGQDYAPTGWATDLFGAAVGPNGNIELAKKLIADSGEAAPALTFDYGKSATADQRAAIIKSSLEAAGFKITLNPITSGYYATIGDPKLQHDFGTSGWGPDWPNASTVIGPLLTGATAFNDASDYSQVTPQNNPDFYAAVSAALSDTDRASQATKWQALNKEAVQKAWVIPNTFLLTQVLAGTKITTAAGLYKWPAYGSWPYAQIFVTQ